MIRGVVQGIGPQDALLFYGGVYDWHDPLTAVRALEILQAMAGGEDGDRNGGAVPSLIVVKNPNPESTPQHKFQQLRQWCAEKGWEGRKGLGPVEEEKRKK